MVSFSLSITISRRPPTIQKSPTNSSLQKSNTPQPKEKEPFIPPSPSRSSISNYKYQQQYNTTSRPTSNNQSGTSILPPHYNYTPRTSSSLPITTYNSHLGDGSFEELLGNQHHDQQGTKFEKRQIPKMVDLNHKDFLTSIDGDRRKSYGIGGAGNIRRPSDVIYPPRINSDGTRRRSSVWSVGGTSPDGKRRWSWFGRKNSVSEEEEINFGDVNLTGGDRETKD